MGTYKNSYTFMEKTTTNSTLFVQQAQSNCSENLQNCKKQNLTNLTKYFPMPISIYLIGQNFCKKQNTKQIFIMALQKKKSRQKTKKTENYFSVDQKKKTIKPLSNITKKILA